MPHQLDKVTIKYYKLENLNLNMSIGRLLKIKLHLVGKHEWISYKFKTTNPTMSGLCACVYNYILHLKKAASLPIKNQVYTKDSSHIEVKGNLQGS